MSIHRRGSSSNQLTDQQVAILHENTQIEYAAPSMSFLNSAFQPRLQAVVYWIRLPLTSGLDHVNIYALKDGSNWVIVDTGTNTSGCIEALEKAFESDALENALNNETISKVIVTHYHSDHIGLAGTSRRRGRCFMQRRLLAVLKLVMA